MSKKSRSNSKKGTGVRNALQAQSKFKQAISLHKNGQLEQAKNIYSEILILFPKNFEVLHLLGIVEAQSSNFPLAIDLISQAININPTNPAFYNNRANSYKELKQFNEANADYKKAIKLRPDYAEAFYNQGNVLQLLKKLDEAIICYQKAITLIPNYLDAIINLGNINRKLKQFDVAKTYYDKAVIIRPDYAEIYFNQGNLSKELGQLNEALQYFHKAIELAPSYAEVYSNLGNTLTDLKRFDEAILYYDKAIDINPDYITAYSNRGNTFEMGGKYKEAIECYKKIISLDPDYVDAYFDLASVLSLDNQLPEAKEAYKQALDKDPNYNYGAGIFNHLKATCSDWENFEEEVISIEKDILNQQKASPPFHTHLIFDDPELQKKAAEIYAFDKYPINNMLGSIKNTSHKKIRLGYFSPDFNEHPIAYLTVELFETHNKEQFELFAFSLAPDNDLPMRKRIKKSFDEFIDVSGMSDQEVVLLAREKEIDIAIDLCGFTKELRTGIFAMRVAPVQISYLGFLGTMGASYVDYIIADEIIISKNSRRDYSEKILYLPHYQCNDSKKEISKKNFTRKELGLPSKGFIYCCFNNSSKITPRMFKSWMRILKEVEGSILWLYAANEWSKVNLMQEAKNNNINQDRIVFGSKLPRSEYLSRYGVADLFLDTHPYNAGTTASDALWVGLPILTFTGKSFSARICSSVLMSADLPELIVSSEKEYELLAIELGQNKEKITEIRKELKSKIKSSALYDIKRFTRSLETGFQKIHQLKQSDLPLKDIVIT